MARPGRGLKFCPETNDLLYPRENKASRLHQQQALADLQPGFLKWSPSKQSWQQACLGTCRCLGRAGDIRFAPHCIGLRSRPAHTTQDRRRLEYYCKNCDYVEDSDPQDW